jgi:hypothetical protein
MDTDMEQYRVHGLPHGLYYIANFVSLEEEQSLLDKVEDRAVQIELTNGTRSRPNDGQSCRIDVFSRILLLWQRVMLSLMRRYPTGCENPVWLE